MKIITPNTNIGTGSIKEAFIKTNAVTTTKIKDANVTTAKILDANITTAKIADANVTTAKLLDANVTTAKIADANVTTDKIADANVTTAKILDANVTEAKIADNAVTADKIADGSINAAKIADGTVVAAELANDAVTEDKILNGSVTVNKIADDAVTLAKFNTSGATNNQVLVYNSTSGAVEWGANSAVDVSNLTDKMKITEASTALSPLLHLKTTNSGSMNGQILLEDSNEPSVSIVGRENTAYDRYSLGFVLDPENNKPRTLVAESNAVTAGSLEIGTSYTILVAGTTSWAAIGAANNNAGTVFTATGAGDGDGTAYPGDGVTYAGDYQISFAKKYSEQDKIIMAMNVFGANNGFEMNSYDDANGGVNAYSAKPIRFNGSDVSFNTNSTERLAFDDNGMHVSGVPFVVGGERGKSNVALTYTGDTGTGDPDMTLRMHNVGDSRLINVMKAWDDGTNTDAVVSVGHTLSVGNQTGANSTNLLILSDQTTALDEKGCYIGNGQINTTTGATSMDGGILLVAQGTDNRVEMRNKLRVYNSSSAPTEPTPGDMFFNTTTNKFQGYDGTAWRNLH